MSEYLEAISRLNAPERNPGISISRSLFPIPRRDTPINMNRIMAETLNSPLPKYSIPQVLSITNGHGETSYTFPLDKQFTLAKGGRKSVGIRAIHYNTSYDEILKASKKLQIKYSLNLSMDFSNVLIADWNKYLKDHPKATYETADWSAIDKSAFGPINVNKDNVTCDYYNLDESIANELNSTLALAYSAPDSRAIVQVVNDNGLIQVKFFGNDRVIVPNSSTISVTFTIKSLSYVDGKDSKGADIVVEIPTEEYPLWIDTKLIATSTTTQTSVYFNVIDCKTLTLPIMTCSSLNPWSPGNIIGPLEKEYEVINRIFPYDNQQEARIWFVDQNKRILPNLNGVFDGYLELELIIDNENNFAIDQD